MRGGTGLFLRVIFDVSWSVCSTCGIFAAIYKVNPSVSVYLVDTVDWSFSHLEILIGFSFFLFFTFCLVAVWAKLLLLAAVCMFEPRVTAVGGDTSAPNHLLSEHANFCFFFQMYSPKSWQ